MNNDIAIEMINNDEQSCVVVKLGEIIYTAKGKGIKPLLNIYIENKEELNGSFLADKVIGKAAALIICQSNVKQVYTKRISQKAIDLLNKYNIKFEYKEKVEYIQNMDKSDMCPLEKVVSNIEGLEEGIKAIIDFVENKKKMN